MALTTSLLAAGCAVGPEEDDSLGSSADELRKCADGPTLRGIDVSKWQASIDWNRVAGSGKAFAIARVSDGLNFPDAYFKTNWNEMKRVGLIRSAYQFFRPKQDPAAQAKMFIDAIDAAGGLGVGDLPPVLDFEVDDGVAANTVAARAQIWLDIVEAKYKIKPIIYTGNNMNHVTGSKFSSYLLWVPNYRATCPNMPPGWQAWAFWQDTDTGSCPGVNGNVDLNYFNGNLAKLQSLTIQPPASNDSGGDDTGGGEETASAD